ncbi:MAG: preprotein translocase subunit SecA [Planctomycetota bacterium]
MSVDWGEAWDRFGEGVNSLMESINRLLLRVFGNSNEREVRKLRPNVEAINALEAKMQALSNEELKGLTAKFRARLKSGESLDDLLVEAFAACRESGRRYLKMRHYDVQLIGGMVLHSGRIAEMVTGEGKTLVATLPAYLNALAGKGVHVVTVNDYLARRDAEWMSPLYTGLGLSVGAIQSNMEPAERQMHYACDITYGTNNEFGFDYLRNNMKPTKELQAQGELFYAIIDEVDSILIDEARTPLIISGPAFDDPQKYAHANRIAMLLRRDEHFEVKEKEHTCHLTDAGVIEAERLVGVESFYTAGNMEWPHLIDNSLKAHYLYRRDKDYMVVNGEVIIIDEHTGRKMEGRQWSDGLHQAVEAKEGVKIKEETQTLATITFQNFFKLYRKISGMTGTAMTEANEFYKIYGLDVVAVPTNKHLQRINYPDVIFCTEKEKWKAVVDEVKLVNKTGRPILVGTASVEKSEHLSDIFNRNGIKHEVLNAKFVEREAEIVAQAGRRGAVTISTNMAGRGTDIILGGNPETKAWSELKQQFATRLDVPPEVWRATMEPYEGPMKEEGRRIAEPPPTVDLAKAHKLRDPEKLAQVVNNASERQKDDPEKLAKNQGIENVAELAELIRLVRSSHPGGLHIVGTERHESRRIDNQLRGRAGHQGDPGSSRFFLSLEDDLMRIFAGDWVRGILQRLGMKEGEAIESRMVSRRIEAAQKKVEERNFEVRKNLLEYDEIMDTQRKRVYGFRQDILEGASCRALILEMIDHQIDKATKNFLDRNYGTNSFTAWVSHQLGTEFDPKDFLRCDFQQAESIAKEESLRGAESLIIEKIDENLDEETDPREWNWEALTQWSNARWGLKLKAYDLKKIGRDAVGQHIYEHAKQAIENVSLDTGEVFFREDFGIRSLLGWSNQKFRMSLGLDDLPKSEGRDAEVMSAFLKQKAREIYLNKEIEFPVHCGLTRFLAEKTANMAARYDREGLVNWANNRFHAHLDLEEQKNLPRQQVQEHLFNVSRDFYRDGRFYGDIDGELAKYFKSGSDSESMASADLEPLSRWSAEKFGKPLDLDVATLSKHVVRRQLENRAESVYRAELREAERVLLLQFLDIGWKDHLYGMDHLKSSIGLRGYAQIDPKVEYKREAKVIFSEMWNTLETKVTDMIFRVEEVDPSFVHNLWRVTNAVHEQFHQAQAPSAPQGSIQQQQEAAIEMSKGEQKTEPIRNRNKRVGRNDPCPCGSGKKYKNCCMNKAGHGRMTA